MSPRTALHASSPYRDGRDAVRTRLLELRERLAEVDGQLASHGGALSVTLQRTLAELRTSAEPSSASAEDMVCAERAAAALEERLDEAIGLAADLQRTVNPVLPSAAVVMRWAGMTGISCGLVVLAVLQLGLGDFMLQAFGVKVQRANATLPCERFSFEAQRAAHGGVAPQHAQWVNPSKLGRPR